MIFNILSIYLFIAILVSVYLATFIQTRGGVSYTKAMTVLCFSICFYMFGYVMELNSTTYQQLMFWNGFQYLTIPLLAAMWLMVALMYTGRFFTLKKWKFIALYAVPVLAILARFTNSYFHLYFASTSSVMIGERLFLSTTFGPFRILLLLHTLITLVVATILFMSNFIHSGNIIRQKNYLMMLSSIILIVGITLNVINPMDFGIDYMVLVLPLACICVFIVIVKYDFLEIKTMAREMAFESSGDGFLLMNYENKIIDMNPKAEEIFNHIQVEVAEIPLEILLSEHEDILRSLQSIQPAVFNVDYDYKVHYFEVLTKAIGNDDDFNQGYFKTIRDVTNDYELNKTLRFQASTDVLSGVLNRRAFMEIGKSIFRDKRHFDVYLLMMDLDHFKGVNDKYGHMVGDEVIREFGKLLRDNFRETDVLCRLGGEEFCVLIRDAGYAAAVSKAESFRKAVENHEICLSGYHFNITVSIGMVRANKADLTVDNLLNEADMALYRSKENGRNQVTVSQ